MIKARKGDATLYFDGGRKFRGLPSAAHVYGHKADAEAHARTVVRDYSASLRGWRVRVEQA